MPIVDEVIHVVVVTELFESLHQLSAAEEAQVEQCDLILWNQLVGCSVKHERRTRILGIFYLAFP